MDQRGQNPHQALFARDVIGVPHLRSDRWNVVRAVRRWIVTAVHHWAAKREVDEVGAFEIGPRTVVPKRRHADHDQIREPPTELCLPEPETIKIAGLSGFQKHIRSGEQSEKLRLVGLEGRVEDDRPLSTIVVPEEQGSFRIGLIFVERPDRSARIAPRSFDFNNVRAKAGQEKSAIFDLLVGNLHHPDIFLFGSLLT
jgi:hypothetical protein